MGNAQIRELLVNGLHTANYFAGFAFSLFAPAPALALGIGFADHTRLSTSLKGI
jgi:hypothetical protein